MAKRKNRKNKTQPVKDLKPAVQPQKEKPVSSNAQNKAGQQTVTKVRSTVSIPVFFSGMFLTLVLGLYLGTLLPDMIKKNQSPAFSAKETDKIKAQQPDSSAVKPEEVKTPESVSAPSSLPKDIAEHVGHLKSELALHPDSAKTWIELGDLYFDSNLPRLSVEAYGRALAIDPGNPDVITDMGIMYRELGEYKKALECFRNANSINPEHTQSLYNEGLILSHDLNDKAGALEAWGKLVKVNPHAVSPHGKTVLQMIEELK